MTEERKGELYSLGRTLIAGVFPVLAILSFGKLPSMLALAWTTFFGGIFFLVLMIYKNLWHELLNITLWKYVSMIVLFICILYYGFLYAGFAITSAGNGGIISLCEVLTSYLFFHIIRNEFFSNDNKVGALLMLLGAVLVLAPNFSGINKGDFLVLIAVFFPPVGNLYAQKAKQIASSVSILFLRCLISTPILFLLAYAFGNHTTTDVLIISLPYLILNGVLYFGLEKILFLESITRISVTKALSLGSIAPFITLIVGWLVLHQAPTFWQIMSLVPLTLGVLFITNSIKISSFRKLSI